VWCHLLLLVPVIMAALFMVFPWTTALVIAAPMGVATALIAYAGWRALRRPVVIGADGLHGRRGEAVSDLDPEGLVRLRDELWLAESRQAVAKRRAVEVLEVAGARLWVRPWT
jgi:membrane-bound serine protease (ClpP class)